MKNNYHSKLIVSGLLLLSSINVYAHSHEHKHDNSPQSEKTRLASKGIFDDHDVKDRTLADWNGTWQSVNNYLINGDLDEVIQAKLTKNPTKTFAEYKAYYLQGYATDIQLIGIEGSRIDFHKNDSHVSCDYEYSGYKILTYASGNKGVRYLFTCKDNDPTAPKFIQFSDHIIEPTQTAHFHIYMGNQSHDKLLTEMNNWPTYYPLSYDKDDIVHEMLHH